MTKTLKYEIKKLLYRSLHRGCKETDYLLGNFAEQKLHTLRDQELVDYAKLLDVDDATIYEWLTEKTNIPDEYNTEILQKILIFHKYKRIKKLFIIAGEASGDVIGGKLIDEVKLMSPDVQIYGIGGQNMMNAGCKILFHYKNISFMGFFEIIPNIVKIIYFLYKAVRNIRKIRPDGLITIDSSGFNFFVAKRVKGVCPIIHYVAPAVWAYKPQRSNTVNKLFDHLLVILPFEVEYFDKNKTTFVGHHIMDEAIISKKKENKENIHLLIMPGSRVQEIKSLSAIFIDVIKGFKVQHPNLATKILTLPHIKDYVSDVFGEFVDEIICDDKKEAMLWADIGLIKSGTSAIEATAFGMPCVVAYKMFYLTYYYIKSIIRVKYITITNIVLNKQVIPELVQEKCSSDNILTELNKLLEKKERSKMHLSYQKAIKLLRNKEGITASKLAAQTILNCIVKN